MIISVPIVAGIRRIQQEPKECIIACTRMALGQLRPQTPWDPELERELNPEGLGAYLLYTGLRLVQRYPDLDIEYRVATTLDVYEQGETSDDQEEFREVRREGERAVLGGELRVAAPWEAAEPLALLLNEIDPSCVAIVGVRREDPDPELVKILPDDLAADFHAVLVVGSVERSDDTIVITKDPLSDPPGQQVESEGSYLSDDEYFEGTRPCVDPDTGKICVARASAFAEEWGRAQCETLLLVRR